MNRLAVALLIVVSGCGDDGAAGPDAATGFQPAPHTALPQMLPHAGQILDAVSLVTVTYSDYALKADVEAFGDAIVDSGWYHTVGAEYGVHGGTHLMKVDIGPSPSTLSDTGIETLLKQLVTAGTLPPPAMTNNEVLYMIYVPSTVTLDPSLQAIYGYHAATMTAGGVRFPYAVVIDDGSGLATTTSTAAHELIESATDPYDPPNDGYYVDPPLPDPWYLILGENADLCDGEALIMEGAYAVQRSYSNAAAAAGLPPCIPAQPGDDWNTVSAEPATMPTVAKGASVTFTLTGWSTREMSDWSLETYDADYADLTAAQVHPVLSAATINNGKTVTLTMTAPANAASGDLGGVYVLSGDSFRPWAVGFIVQ